MQLTLFERSIINIINKALTASNNNQVKAARLLGISRGTLRKYLKMGGYKGKSLSKCNETLTQDSV